MKPCPACSTPMPASRCPHCQGRPSRLSQAVNVLGLSLVAGGLAACTSLYGIVVTGESREPDQDVDGYGADVDCDDSDSNIYPGAAETAGDGIDSNCDGEDDPQA